MLPLQLRRPAPCCCCRCLFHNKTESYNIHVYLRRLCTLVSPVYMILHPSSPLIIWSTRPPASRERLPPARPWRSTTSTPAFRGSSSAERLYLGVSTRYLKWHLRRDWTGEWIESSLECGVRSRVRRWKISLRHQGLGTDLLMLRRAIPPSSATIGQCNRYRGTLTERQGRDRSRSSPIASPSSPSP